MTPRTRFRIPSILLTALVLGAPQAKAASVCDVAPTVTVVLTNGAVGVPVVVNVTAHDANGDAITSLTADVSALPAGNNAVFTANATNTAGTLVWTPQAGQAGSYPVTYTASNSLSGSAGGTIQVTDTGGVPFVQPIPNVVTAPGSLVTFPVYAGDPDGDPILSLTMAAPAPPGATFVTNPANTLGTFSWTVPLEAAGNYAVTFTASNGQSGSTTVTIVVLLSAQAPVVQAPASISGQEGSPISFCVTALSAENGPLSALTMSPLPPGAQFAADPTNEVGAFSWTPGAGQAGTYTVYTTAWTATTPPLAASAATTIFVTGVNHPPIANPGGPYAGVVGVPVQLNGTGSSDPDGQPLQYSWTIEGVGTAVGSTPLVTFAMDGTHAISLTVTDNGSPPLSGSATTSAAIVASLDARVYTVGGNQTIRLGSNKATWCAEVEPVDGDFAIGDVDPASLALVFGDGRVAAISGKTIIGSDHDHNGVTEITACFAKADLRPLFAGLPSGKSEVTVRVEGMTFAGAPFGGETTLEVSGGGSSLAPSISPNPLNPEATLTFRTERPGPISVRVFDAQGRLVRDLWSDRSAAPGTHDVRIDGRGSNGEPLASGIYWYRIDAPGGTATGQFAVLK